MTETNAPKPPEANPYIAILDAIQAAQDEAAFYATRDDDLSQALARRYRELAEELSIVDRRHAAQSRAILGY